MAATGMVRFLLLLQFLSLSCAYELNCTVSQNGDLTYYNITDTSNVGLTDCYYDWTNETNHVLANQGDQMKGLVVKNSINLLVTSKCINTTYLTRTCIAEDEQRTAVCNTICHESVHVKGLLKVSPNNWIGFIPVGLPLLLLVGLGFVCYKYKDKISRWCCCGQSKCQYPAANMQKTPTNEPAEVPLV